VPSSAQVLHGEGPAGGLCLARCVPGHDFCNGFDANAKCRVLDDGGTPNDPSDDLAYCLPGCKIGDTKDPDKCRNRRDVVCSENPAGSGAGFCIPMCSSDIDCKPRVCDIRTGLCGDVSPTGDAIGSVCSVDNDTCAGACLPGLNFPQCSAPCSYGEPGACGQNRTTPPYDYFCAIDAALGSGPGDLGYCSRACLCDDDCARADAVCEPDPSLVAKTGRSGICGSKLLPSGVARKNLPCK
jgi:hypothetical protein